MLNQLYSPEGFTVLATLLSISRNLWTLHPDSLWCEWAQKASVWTITSHVKAVVTLHLGEILIPFAVKGSKGELNSQAASVDSSTVVVKYEIKLQLIPDETVRRPMQHSLPTRL